jgi:glycosyltransferase involved in cell wall biosynthesis
LLREHNENVVYIAPGTLVKEDYNNIGVKFIQCKMPRNNPVGILASVKKMSRIAKTEQIEVFHCQDAFSCLIVCMAKKLFKMKGRIIFHLRSISFRSYPRMLKLSTLIDMTVCNSLNERTLLLMNNFPPEKTCVIYNAIEKQKPAIDRNSVRKEFGILPNEFVIGSVGRLVTVKGVDYLIRAVAASEIQNIKILIVGDGKEHDSLMQLAKQLGIENRVIIAGYRKDIANMYAAMDLFALPSLYEAFGNVVVEAMYSKVPVLASYVGGVPEIITNHQNGFLAPAGDIEQWSEAITEIYNQRNNMQTIVERAYQDACDRYNFEKYYSLISKVYEG